MNFDITRRLTLDLINPNCYNLIYAIQVDSQTQYIAIKFTHNDEPYTLPDNAEIRVNGQNAIGDNIFSECTIKNNKAILKLSQNIIHEPSRIKCVLDIYTPVTNQLLYSIDFHISFTGISIETDPVTNSSEYSALVNTMMKAKLLINKTRKNIHIFELIKKKWKAIKLDALETITDTNIAKDNAIQATDDLRELEADITEAEGIRREHEDTRESQEQARQSNEDIRKSNENSRQENESNRQEHENIRSTQENTREDNEAVRKMNESLRQSQENTRQDNEDIRQNNEGIRNAQEIVREDNEAIRIANENLQLSQEDTRQENEDARDTAENIRQDSESERQENENTRESQEDVRQSNENIRLMNESIRQDQEDDRQSNETIREGNEAIRIANEMSRQSQEDDRNNSEDNRQSDEITRQQQEADRQSNTSNAIANVETATQDAIDATENADKAADRANLAAEGCEEIIAGTGFISVTEKGAADGLATLDSNKKLAATQLPLGETTTTAFAGDRGKALEDAVGVLETGFAGIGELVNLPNEIIYKCTGDNDLGNIAMLAEYIQIKHKAPTEFKDTLKKWTIKVVGEVGIDYPFEIKCMSTDRINIVIDFSNATFPKITQELINSSNLLGVPTDRWYLFIIYGHSYDNASVTLKGIDLVMRLEEFGTNTSVPDVCAIFHLASNRIIIEDCNMAIEEESIGNLNAWYRIFEVYQNMNGAELYLTNISITNLSAYKVVTADIQQTEIGSATYLNGVNIYTSMDEREESLNATSSYPDPRAKEIIFHTGTIFHMQDSTINIFWNPCTDKRALYTSGIDVLIERCTIQENEYYTTIYPMVKTRSEELILFDPNILGINLEKFCKAIVVRDCSVTAHSQGAFRYSRGISSYCDPPVLFDNVDIILSNMPMQTIRTGCTIGISIEAPYNNAFIDNPQVYNVNPTYSPIIIRNSSIISRVKNHSWRDNPAMYPSRLSGVTLSGCANLLIEGCRISLEHSAITLHHFDIKDNGYVVGVHLKLPDGVSVSNISPFSTVKVVDSTICAQLDGQGDAYGIHVNKTRASLKVQNCEILTHSHAIIENTGTSGIRYHSPETLNATDSIYNNHYMTVRDTLFCCSLSDIARSGTVSACITCIPCTIGDPNKIGGKMVIDGCIFAENVEYTDKSMPALYTASNFKIPITFINNHVLYSRAYKNTLDGTLMTISDSNYGRVDQLFYMPQYSNYFTTSVTSNPTHKFKVMNVWARDYINSVVSPPIAPTNNDYRE